ncbi:MAG: helix-turn-helix domain-containing protein [Lentisphaeria bacterium]|nr:helix-turn-helix domain-containing protein [Lentisphaeria bacterium]
MRQTIPANVLSATCALLGPYVPTLDPPALTRALEAVKEAKRPGTVLLTVNEAASRLRVSRRTLWRMIQAGSIRPLRLGPRTVRIAEADISALDAGGQGDGRS